MRKEFKEAAKSAGFEILDIYRFRSEDVVRVKFKGRVYLVKLGRFYDSMKPDDFVSILKKEVSS